MSLGDARKTETILKGKELSGRERRLREEAFRSETICGENYLRNGFGVDAEKKCEAADSKAIGEDEKKEVQILQDESKELELHKRKALKSYADGQLASAAEEYASAVQIAHKSHRLQQKLETVKKIIQLQKEGEELMAAQRFDEATTKFAAALDLESSQGFEDVKLHEEVEQAREHSGNKVQVDCLLKQAEEAAGGPTYDYGAAAKLYENAFALDPTNGEIKSKRAGVRKQLKARAQLEQLCNLAELHMSTKEFEEAVDVFTKALQIMTEKDDLFDHDEAKKKQLEEKRAEARCLQQVHENIAEGRRKMMFGNYKDAIACFEAAHALAPGDSSITKEGEKARAFGEARNLQNEAQQLGAEAETLENTAENAVDGEETRRLLREAEGKRHKAAQLLLDALHIDKRNHALEMEQMVQARKDRIDHLQEQGLDLLESHGRYADAATTFGKALSELTAEDMAAENGAMKNLQMYREGAQALARAKAMEDEADSLVACHEHGDAVNAYTAAHEELQHVRSLKLLPTMAHIVTIADERLTGKINTSTNDAAKLKEKRAQQRHAFEAQAQDMERQKALQELKTRLTKQINDKDFAPALAIIVQALKSQPTDDDLCTMQEQCEKGIAAAHAVEQAAHAQDTKVLRLRERGIELLLATGDVRDYGAALEAFKHANSLSPDNEEIRMLICKTEEALRCRAERVELLNRARTAKAGRVVKIVVMLPASKQPGDQFKVMFPDGHTEIIDFPQGKAAGDELELSSHSAPDWQSLTEMCPPSTPTDVLHWSLAIEISPNQRSEYARFLTPAEERELIEYCVEGHIHLGVEEYRRGNDLENVQQRQAAYSAACQHFTAFRNETGKGSHECMASWQSKFDAWLNVCQTRSKASLDVEKGKTLLQESPPKHAEARAILQGVLTACRSSNFTEACTTVGEPAPKAWIEKIQSLVERCKPTPVRLEAKVIEKHIEKAAVAVFKDLNIDADGMVNYMRFINWFKKQLKKTTGSSKISDETLQETMEVWHRTDADGSGVDKEKLQKVLNMMLSSGLIHLAEDGSIVK
eukprot:SAG31_NODE_111_length_24443_cov_231.743685_3_plen_1046_part_00